MSTPPPAPRPRRRRRPVPAGFTAPTPDPVRGFARASYATTCGTCGELIDRGQPIVPRSGGGYQHPRCAPGADDR